MQIEPVGLRDNSRRVGAFPCIRREFDVPRFTRRVMSVLLCAIATLLLPASSSFGASAPAGWKPFAPDSIWNLRLRDDVALDARSAANAAWLDSQVEAHGAWISTSSCAMPIYWADASTATVRVSLSSDMYQDPALLRAWSAVPIPSGATPSNCTDKNFAVIQRQPDGSYKSWEFWAAAKQSDGNWVARWGGVTQDLAADSGVASSLSWHDPEAPTAQARRSHAGWHVTASSISMIAGVITARDVEKGHIDHALALAIPKAARGFWRWPAQRGDGNSDDVDALPEGARLRLDPNVDVASLNMPPLVRMMAEAAQKYGIVVRDQTWSSTTFYTEEVKYGEANPFKPLLNNLYADKALASFPWDDLLVLQAPACIVRSSCETTQQAAIDLFPAAAAPRIGESLSLDTTNSALNHPRTKVEWDLDGDGTFETDAGRDVKTTYVPAASGPTTVQVRITTRSGSVVQGQRTLDVAAAQSEAIPVETAVTPFGEGNGAQPAGTGSTTTRPASGFSEEMRKKARRAASGELARQRRAHHKEVSRSRAARRSAR